MTLTGRLIREARMALGLEPWQVAKAAGVTVSELILAEVSDERCSMTVSQAQAIRRALEAAGVEFTPENGGGAGVRLRKAASDKGAER